MDNILAIVQQILVHLVGGTYGEGSSAVTITVANSWIGKTAAAITANPIVAVFVLTGLVFLGLNALRKLMRV